MTPQQLVSIGHQVIEQSLRPRVRFNTRQAATMANQQACGSSSQQSDSLFAAVFDGTSAFVAVDAAAAREAEQRKAREEYDAAYRATREKLDEAERVRLVERQKIIEQELRDGITQQVARAEAAQERLDSIRTKKRLVRSRADYS